MLSLLATAARVAARVAELVTPVLGDTDRDLDDIDDDGDAEIIDADVDGDPPRNIPDGLLMRGVGAFLQGHGKGRWLRADASVRLGDAR